MATILLTGASGGFGKLATQALIEAGHDVAATLRDPAGRNRAVTAELRQLGAHPVELDVTDDASVAAGVARARELVGAIDVLVNNAGVGVQGFTEAFTPADLQRVFEINVVGVHRLSRAVIPGMRERGRGLILNISSVLGRMTIPFYGPYNAAKWALEALTENYRTELSAFGVDVALIEPGGFPTNFMANLIRPSDTARTDEYGAYRDAPEQAFAGFQEALANNPAQDPALVAEAIRQVVDTPAGSRPFRTVVDRMGMGDAIAPYNDQLHELTAGIYGAFGYGEMLQLRT